MDYIACVCKLRPDVTWEDNVVNGFSLDTIRETYQSSQAMPTVQECEAVWPEIELENQEEIKRTLDIKLGRNSGGLNRITIEEADAWLLARLLKAHESVALAQDIQTIKVAMNQILLAVYEVNSKELPYLLK